MMLGIFIAQLKSLEAKFGPEMEITISSDQETHRDGKPVDDEIYAVQWCGEGEKVESIMLCDRFTVGELHDSLAEETNTASF